jgi:hypothetical protein
LGVFGKFTLFAGAKAVFTGAGIGVDDDWNQVANSVDVTTQVGLGSVGSKVSGFSGGVEGGQAVKAIIIAPADATSTTLEILDVVIVLPSKPYLLA